VGLEEPTVASNAAGFSAVEHGSGILSMTVSNVRAGASGILRPPSQCLIASRLNRTCQESGLCHAQSISDRLHVNFLGHMRLESFLLPSKESLNVVQAIHHPLELRFHAISHESIKCLENAIGPRPQRVALCLVFTVWTGFLSRSSEKPQ